jgi:hypothetical protein
MVVEEPYDRPVQRSDVHTDPGSPRAPAKLPNFTIAEYDVFLRALLQAGYALRPVTEMADRTKRSLFLRHDIDFSPELSLPMARADAAVGARSTFYVLLSALYNPRERNNLAAIREIGSLGHEVGLHYDLEEYPSDPAGARRQLERDCESLAEITRADVRTITMHQPSLGGDDLFRNNDSYIHPHDPRLFYDVLYSSDSCRAYRDESMLRCFDANPPDRVMWLTHAELWLAEGPTPRYAYLEDFAMRITVPHRAYYHDEVRRIWENHSGVAAHDARESSLT